MVSFLRIFCKAFVFQQLLSTMLRKPCTHCTGLTLGTPIAVFVPNTDQRGVVSFSCIGESKSKRHLEGKWHRRNLKDLFLF
jgi:hypothetical protein